MAPKAKKAAGKTVAAAEPEKKKAAAAAAKTREEPKAVEPEKRKAEAPAGNGDVAEPPRKEAKSEEYEEVEVDSIKEKRPVLKEPISFNLEDTTLNVVPIMGGQVLSTLTDGGMQYLIAGARANAGMKKGRYMFEVKIVEMSLPEAGGFGGWKPNKPILRCGFSSTKTPLVLGESEDHVYFDLDGNFCTGGKRTVVMKKVLRDQTIGILLNLDPSSENKNTISCFANGVRFSKPQPLPEGLCGKTLFPHLSFRNMKVMVNFGPELQKPLSFKCTPLAGAAAADIEQKEPVMKDGKCEVVVPVGFPDEGTFEWADSFLEANPHFVELSNRKIVDWAISSGLQKHSIRQGSRDKPEFNFNLPGMDDGSIRRIMNSVAPMLPRNYLIMEVKNNLIESQREVLLRKFSPKHYKKIARVVMGEPTKEWKAKEQAKILQDKQAKSDTLWRNQQVEKKRRKEALRKAKELAEKRKKIDEERKKRAEEMKKKMEEAKEARKKEEEAKKKAAAEKAGAKKADDKTDEGKKYDEKKDESKDDEKNDEVNNDSDSKNAEITDDKMEVDEGKQDVVVEDEKNDTDEKAGEESKTDDQPMVVEEDDEEEETEPPKVELTEEEKKLSFAPRSIPDLTVNDLSQSFAKFSLPSKSEGFDEVKFEWQKESAAKEYLRRKLVEKKKTLRIDDLKPGAWFHETLKAWNEKFSQWQAKLAAYKTEAAKAKDAKDDDAEEKDIKSVEDITDVGNGVPLFKDFGSEDWALLQLRFELFLLQVAFKKDVNDEDRPGVQEKFFSFYFNRYFKKFPNMKGYGVDDSHGLLKLVKDTVAWEEDILVPKTDIDVEDFSVFVKLCETSRRERQLRLDAGDESARLKISPNALKGLTFDQGRGNKKGGGKGPKMR